MQCKISRAATWAACLAFVSSFGIAACSSKTDGPAVEEGGHVSVAVAPLDYPGLTDAVYRLTVKNHADQTVWQKTISSAQYGDSSGSASYVGTCDAQSNPNAIELEIESLSAAGNTLSPTSDYANPAPLGDPIKLEATCEADKDVPVEFNLNVARAGEQGFFDISVNFQDLFCSAKLDCERNGQPLELLYQPHTGERDLTAILGFACTAGPDQDTYLHMNQVTIDCTGANAQTFYVDSQSGPGNLYPPFAGPPNDTDLIFQSATYRGEELIGNNNKFYWNVAVGLNEAAFPNLQPCTLHATATASDGPLTNGTTPDGMRWPYVEWNVPLFDGSGNFACSAYELGGSGGEVAVKYTDSPILFTASVQRSNATQTVLNGCDATEACGDCTSSCLIGSGTGVDNTTTGGTGGDPAPTISTELETKVNPDDITGLVASPTGGLTLADQNYDLPFLWAANHDDGTVSKIDTRDMKEVGRYYVCGAQGGSGPSRTAVDLQGNAFVTCRFNGHVTKIGVIPPECKDTNGTPGIQTSEDTNDDGIISGSELLPWGQDECIIWDKAPAVGATCNTSSICGRAAGVDVNNDVWIGIWANTSISNRGTLYRLDGQSGTTKDAIALPERPYGLAIGPNGTIWVASRDTNGALVKVNPQTHATVTWKSGGGNGTYTGSPSTDNYGIALDPWGAIWLGQYQQGGLKRFVPNADGTSGTWSNTYGSGYTRGVGVKAIYDTSGNVTGAEVYSGHQYSSSCFDTVTYAKLDATGTVVASGNITVPGANGPVGNAIDVDGNQWAVNYCNGTATRYLVTWDASNNPTVNVHGTVTIGNHPYSYSDMTGQALRNLAGVTGHYQHRWTGWGTGSTWWKSVTLDGTLPGGPTVTWLEVKWRSADTEADLDNNVVPWTTAFIVNSDTAMPLDLSPDGTTRRTNKYFELSVDFFTTDPGGQVPELNGIGLAVYHI